MTLNTDHIGRWAAGLVFISTAFLTARAGEGVDDKLCFRAEGTRIVHNGSGTARQLNDMAAALDEFDELWANVTPSGGGGDIRISGEGTFGNGISSYECYDSTCWRPDGFSWGLAASSMPRPHEDFPYWDSGFKRYASVFFDNDQDPLECNSTPIDPNDWSVPGLVLYAVAPNANPPGSGKAIQWGSTLFMISFPDIFQIVPSFNIGGPLYAWPDIITRLPEGSECLEAWMTAKVDGLLISTSTHYYERRSLEFEAPIVNSDNTIDETSGNLSFSAFAIRRNSQQVTDINGNPITVPDYRLKSLGTSIPTSMSDGKWTRLDVTNLVQGLIDHRDSDFGQWCLWPSVGPSPSASTDSLGDFLLAQIGDYDAGITATDECDYDFFIEASTQFNQADSFEVGTILARFRLPDGSLTPVIPIVAPKFMP